MANLSLPDIHSCAMSWFGMRFLNFWWLWDEIGMQNLCEFVKMYDHYIRELKLIWNIRTPTKFLYIPGSWTRWQKGVIAARNCIRNIVTFQHLIHEVKVQVTNLHWLSPATRRRWYPGVPDGMPPTKLYFQSLCFAPCWHAHLSGFEPWESLSRGKSPMWCAGEGFPFEKNRCWSWRWLLTHNKS